MQNKGLIKVFAILFGLVSLYQLSFTFLANKVEDDAKVYAETKATDNNARQKATLERQYLDSIGDKNTIDLGVTKFSYNDVRDKEMNLGLDLKGGINAILQVSVKEVLKSLANDSKNIAFNKALDAADERLKNDNANYLDLFFEEFENVAGTTIQETKTQKYGEVKNRICKLNAKPRITDEAMYASDLDLYAHLMRLLDEEIVRKIKRADDPNILHTTLEFTRDQIKQLKRYLSESTIPSLIELSEKLPRPKIFALSDFTQADFERLIQLADEAYCEPGELHVEILGKLESMEGKIISPGKTGFVNYLFAEARLVQQIFSSDLETKNAGWMS